MVSGGGFLDEVKLISRIISTRPDKFFDLKTIEINLPYSNSYVDKMLGCSGVRTRASCMKVMAAFQNSSPPYIKFTSLFEHFSSDNANETAVRA